MITTPSLVSIIIPSFNNEKFILRSVNSILNQDYNYIECIVVDDGSTDSTQDLLLPLITAKKIHYIKQENAGVCSARNHGARAAKGDYFIFLDADDLLLDGAVKKMVNSLINADADLCVGLEKNSILDLSFPYHENYLANLISNWWPVSAVMVKKNDVLWNEHRKTWEVIEYFAAILISGFKATICPSEVTKIDHNYRDDRTTIIYDHYNSESTFDFFYTLKDNIVQSKKLNHGILESIDNQLLANAYTLFSLQQIFPKKLTDDTIFRNNISTYNWYKPFGLSGFCRFFGLKKGIKIFYYINHYLNRV